MGTADDIAEAKRTWRRLLGGMFSLLPRETRREADDLLAERLREFVFEARVERVLGFAPMADEPDVTPFFRKWLEEGGTLAMPVWHGADRMTMRFVSDIDRDLRPGRAGILEPADGLPEANAADFDLIVAPGRAFSESCARLGRGAGCYDRLFRDAAAQKVGIAYDFQVFPQLPAGPDDECVDLLLTPMRIVKRYD